MEAKIRHSPIRRVAPICNTYGNPHLVRVYCTCCTKSSRANITSAHADTVAPGDYAFQFCEPAMSTCAFPSSHREERDGPIIPFPIRKTYGCGVAHVLISISFL